MQSPHAPASKVLLVHPARQAMGDARRRAEAMAQVLGAQLTIVKLSRPTQVKARTFFPQANQHDSMRAMNDELREARVIGRWRAARELRGLMAVEIVRSSPSLDALVELCQQPGVALVVLPGSFAWFASRLTGLAARGGVPVLVARRPDREECLLVATNLEDPTRPVVQRALELSARLDVQLTIVHNRPGYGALISAAALGGTLPLVALDDGAEADTLERTLKQEFGALGRPAEVTVTTRLDSAAGILEASSRARADLIVVGVRAGAAPGFFAEHVAERVCSAADRSVLLVPV